MSGNSSLQFGKYKEAVLEFVNNNGMFITYSKDKNLKNTLSRLIKSNLGVQTHCIINYHYQSEIYNYLQNREDSGHQIMLFMERVLDGKSSLDLVINLKETYNNLYIVLLTTEVERAALVRYYEAGVENFITKPFSQNTMLEKIAFTLRPQSKIGQLLDRARRLMEDGEMEKALKKCDEVLNIKPNSASAFIIKGDIYRKQGQREEAIEQYYKAHQKSHLYLEPLKRLSEYFADLGEDREQLKFLMKLDNLSPLNIERKVEIGSLHVKMQEKDAGRQYFDQALKLAGKQVKDILGNLALQIAEAIMPFDNAFAEQYFRKAIQIKGSELDLGDVETINRLAICLRQQKKPKQAIQEYSKALQLSPDNDRLMYNMAMACLEAGDVEKAKENIDRLREINSEFYKTSEVVSYNMGIVLVYNKENEAAKKYFQEALHIKPGYSPAEKMLSKLEQ